ncbi:MAG: hypothetical protein ACYTBJ_18695 [Planctomycetota bacterium]
MAAKSVKLNRDEFGQWSCTNEEEQGSYCSRCGSETEDDGADYCDVCWDDINEEVYA